MTITFGAAEAARRLRARELSSTELVRALIDRIESVNPRVNAVREVLAESALRAARASDERLRQDRPVGPLDGVPVTIKDNTDVAGSATTHGVASLANRIATEDAPVVAALRRAGAIPLARTNMPDFALRWHTDSGILGPTVNPWNPELTPGGSSGGEAVSLATGMSLLGVGTDFGGSLRWPSQCAGTAALRPTLGRTPQDQAGATINLQLMDVTGPMARNIADLRPAFEIMVAPDPRDPWHAPVPASYAPEIPRRVHVLEPEDEGIRIAAKALEAHGYELTDEIPPGADEAADAWPRFMAADARRTWPAIEHQAATGGRRFMAEVFDLFGPGDHGELLAARHRLARGWGERLVLAPIYAGRPFGAGHDVGMAAEIVANLRATLIANFLGLPSVAVPIGMAGGLPQVVQVIGPRFGEALCLDAAEAMEAHGLTPIDPQAGTALGGETTNR